MCVCQLDICCNPDSSMCLKHICGVCFQCFYFFLRVSLCSQPAQIWNWQRSMPHELIRRGGASILKWIISGEDEWRNGLDKCVQPMIHIRERESKDEASPDLCLMDLIPSDGLNGKKKCSNQKISIMKLNCLCQSVEGLVSLFMFKSSLFFCRETFAPLSNFVQFL